MTKNDQLAEQVGQGRAYKEVPPVQNYCSQWRNGQSSKTNAEMIRLSGQGQNKSNVNPFRSIR